MSKYCPDMKLHVTYLDCMECEDKNCMKRKNTKIAIIDADFVSHKRSYNFPNIACMKISRYYKQKYGDDGVHFLTCYDNVDYYQKVFVSKVFTNTYVPDNIVKRKNVHCGGTGFYYDKAKHLPYDIEHIKPDYDLYNGLCEGKYFKDYSIGFLTRGCFRKCPFCVNKKYNQVFKASDLSEFIDAERKKICLLDDNFLGYHGWREEIEKLIETGKPFQFKQGLDERLLTKEKCKVLSQCKYDGEYIFAFDNVDDYKIIEEKLNLLRSYISKPIKFYVLCGFDYTGKYDNDFWKWDIYELFIRIDLLRKYNVLPYVMRYEKCYASKYRCIYTYVANWCNTAFAFKTMSFEEFCAVKNNSSRKAIELLESEFPDLKQSIKLKWRH